MNRDEIINYLSDGSVALKSDLSNLPDETLQIILDNFNEVKHINPNTIIESVSLPGGKSLTIKLSVTINTLPYVVTPGQ